MWKIDQTDQDLELTKPWIKTHEITERKYYRVERLSAPVNVFFNFLNVIKNPRK